MQLYLAGPLFSVAARTFNKALATETERLDPTLAVVLPQERTALFLGKEDTNAQIYQDCLHHVRQSDAVIAILEGEDVDSGTAVELGYAVALQKPILGLRTDFRAAEERGVNLMVAFACTEMVLDIDASVASLAQRIVAFCGRLRPA